MFELIYFPLLLMASLLTLFLGFGYIFILLAPIISLIAGASYVVLYLRSLIMNSKKLDFSNDNFKNRLSMQSQSANVLQMLNYRKGINDTYFQEKQQTHRKATG